MTLLHGLAEVSGRVANTASRLEKTREIANFLRALAPDEIPIGIAFLSGETRQGKLGARYSTLAMSRGPAPAEEPVLTLSEVDRAFAEFSEIRGSGSNQARIRALTGLYSRATALERDFLTRLVVGELRQGALRGLMLEAIGAASGVALPVLRKAAMSAGGLAEVAREALVNGGAGLSGFAIRLMQPVLPMLSQSASDAGAALEALGTAAFEWKLDGARIQVHKAGEEVRVYTRNLNDVTSTVPEVVAAVRTSTQQNLILDGEVIALRDGGAPLPFQDTMRRFGRKRDVEAMRAELPLSAFFFDCLFRGDEALAERPAAERFEILRQALPAALLVPRIVTSDPAETARFLDDALARGHEGIMAKALDSRYEAGRRGKGWFKIKLARTLDLVVLAAEWGNGRRSGKLSNLHLGARDPVNGGFVMLGKTFKGMTDEMLEWQTAQFLSRQTGRDAMTVHVRPEMVVEIAFNELQASARYPGGLALRFARVKGYRPDKRPEDADTIDTVRRCFEAQAG